MKTAELQGAALDWAVAKCEGIAVEYVDDEITKCLLQKPSGRYAPSTNWAQGGPIIERERISIRPDTGSSLFRAFVIRPPDGLSNRHIGQTPLLAAMRCYVASKLGDEIELPEELK